MRSRCCRFSAKLLNMRSRSTMKPRDAMTFLLVVTLFTNLARHDLGTVSALSDAERRSLSSKRRYLQRMIRHQQTTLQQTTTKKLYSSYRVPRNSSSDMLDWFLSNYLPDKDTLRALESSSEKHREKMVSLLKRDFGPEEPELKSPFPDYEEEEDLPQKSAQFRRHVSLLTPNNATEAPTTKEMRKKRKKERKAEAQQRREAKKRKRNRKKKKRRKEDELISSLIANESLVLHNIDGEDFFDCCPSKLIVVEKLVGKDRNHHAVEVRPSHQYFYERVCLPDIDEKECLFPGRTLRKGAKTRCTHQFSFAQAQVRPYKTDKEWKMDYIHVRSGCTCQVSNSVPRKRKKNRAP